MVEYTFYVKGDRSRSWSVTATTYTQARAMAEKLSGIPKSKLIGYKVPLKKNPSVTRAFVIMAQRGVSKKAPLMWFDGRKFTNNDPPHLFGSADRAKSKARILIARFAALHPFRVWVDRPSRALLARRRNPESPGLQQAARLLQNFSGHPARRVIKVRPRSNAREGLVIGELDLIGYRTKRAGINGGQLAVWGHDFGKGSRPLLAVSKDGKQLHIVGGQYEFTDAGIEDR
jgi:hypothetical protein